MIHDWRIVAPWYRWERIDGLEPERAAEAERPVLHKFVSTDFVKDFLADPQRSVTFDADLDVHQSVEKIPAAELAAPDGRVKSLSLNRLVPTDTRKLFLAAHQRFYLVAVGIHCDQPGFPMVDPADIAEVGFVIRRHMVDVPAAERAQGAVLLKELTQARAVAGARHELDTAKERSRLLHPFAATNRTKVASVGAATRAAHHEIDRARRRLRVWADAVGVEDRTQGWIGSGEGSFGEWMPIADEPEELVERWYPMRRLTPPPHDPTHAAHDGTIFYAAVPTGSDEVTGGGRSRFSALDTYEIRVFVRAAGGDCPGPVTWSQPSQVFRLASFYDPAGSAQRPLEIRLPDFAELAASNAMPSVRMTQPPGSSLEFAKFGDVPTKGTIGAAEEICFFSIPLITIIAMFVLNLFLPVVMFIFQLWWMLKLKFCIPPSVDFELDLAAELSVTPPELEVAASFDIDVMSGVDQDDLREVVRSIFDVPLNPLHDNTPIDRRLWSKLDDPTTGFSNDPLVKLAVRNGYGRGGDGAPIYTLPLSYTSAVRRDQVVHP